MSDQSTHPDTQGPASRGDTAASAGDIRGAAMDLLARREHARSELQSKLQRRFNDPALVTRVLDDLAAENLQSDARYAESLLRQRLDRGYGPLRIRQEMRERGVSQERILAALEVVDPDWYEAATRAFQRKFGQSRDLQSDGPGESPSRHSRREAQQQRLKEKARRIRFMQYRGFLPEHFRHLLED
jgi:regulatory protein